VRGMDALFFRQEILDCGYPAVDFVDELSDEIVVQKFSESWIFKLADRGAPVRSAYRSNA
jgi:hypothetical protein